MNGFLELRSVWNGVLPDADALGKVAVLMGGTSGERDVSLMSGSGVLQALQARGVQAQGFDPALAPLHQLKEQGFDRAFIALHGRMGEDGCIQGALEWLGIPYTGSGVMASALAMDKVMTKRIWMDHGLPTPAYELVGPKQQTREHLRTIPDRLGLPLIVKPPHEGSSLGVSKVAGYSDMNQAVEEATKYEPEALCEEFIDGAEVTCPVLGSGHSAQALPVVRIEAPEGKYDYENKYFTDVTRYHCPSGLPPALESEIQSVVLRAYQALGCRGWARADLMIRSRDSRPYLLEMNTSPGMTSHSLVPKSAAAAGIDYPSLCMLITALARLDHGQRDQP